MDEGDRDIPEGEGQSAIAAALEFGIDLSLLRANLELTPSERIERADALLRDVLEIRKRAAPPGSP